MSKRNYNRDNCDSILRAVITDKWGRTISLFGKHVFEWEIVIESCGKFTARTFSTGHEARKEFNNLKRKKI